MEHGNHLKHMLIIGGVLLMGLLAFGVPTTSALTTAAVLACPIGMAAMKFFMMRGAPGHAASHDGSHAEGAAPALGRTQVGPQQ